MVDTRELRNGAAMVGIAWLAFTIGTLLWLPIVAIGVDQSVAEPRGFAATGIRAALGVIGGVLAGLASGYLLDSTWWSRWRIACSVLVAWQYTRITRIGQLSEVDAVVTFLPGLLAGVAAFVAFPLGRRLLKRTANARVA